MAWLQRCMHPTMSIEQPWQPGPAPARPPRVALHGTKHPFGLRHAPRASLPSDRTTPTFLHPLSLRTALHTVTYVVYRTARYLGSSTAGTTFGHVSSCATNPQTRPPPSARHITSLVQLWHHPGRHAVCSCLVLGRETAWTCVEGEIAQASSATAA